LGTAEAGLFPGIVVYLTHWFRHEDRARAGAWFFSAIPFANIVGSPLAGWLLGVHWSGVTGWRWLFVLEGVPAVLLGIVTPFYLTDRPHQARWLSPEEQGWIQQELQREKEAKKATRSCTVWEALRKREVLLLALINFLSITGLYGFNFWFPTILKRATGLPNLTVTSLAVMPYVLGLGAMIWFGWHSDRTLERRWHTAWPLFLCGALTVLSVGLRSNLWVSLGALILAGSFSSAFMPSFWALPTALLSESAAAASIGLITSVGNLGGFVGPYIIGYFGSLTHSFTPGLLILVAALLLAGIIVLRLRVLR
jgi:MFS family permease